jgi:hypothetical protein
MVGDLVTNVATRCWAEPGDLYAAARILDGAGAGRPAMVFWAEHASSY